jgi:protein-S-isoprenylcysteine O-methyltransferase Ste14
MKQRSAEGTMTLRVPPPIVTALCAALMWAVGRFVPLGTFAPKPGWAIAIFVVALALMLTAAVQFARAHTTINPMRPERASHLVTNGVFAWSRNPIYLADLLVLVGIAIWIGHLLAFAGCALFVVWMNRYQIGPEEAALTRRFGDDYLQYCARVRRWL